jgi:hypothetical protein
MCDWGHSSVMYELVGAPAGFSGGNPLKLYDIRGVKIAEANSYGHDLAHYARRDPHPCY